MSDATPTGAAERAWFRPMRPRSLAEAHRAATPLELLFDLCFVVAVAQAGGRLHHALAENHVGEAVLGYGMAFFAIWWAWMNFTWYASAYDCDDVLYRLATLVQIAGALILAAGIPRAFDARDFSIVTLGYAVMRVSLVAQWLRAARADPAGRRTALRFASGVAACQLGWLALLALPAGWYPAGWLVMAAAELLVPVWAEAAHRTPWNPHHIAERYGLFTLIVLGESVLAASLAIQSALDTRQATASLFSVAAGGLLAVFAMWWLYFAKPADRFLTSNRAAFVWGYGHLPIWAAAAAIGAGLALAVDHATGHAALPAPWAGAAVTIPATLYVLTVWGLQVGPHHAGSARLWALPLTAAVLILAATVTPQPILLTGLLLTALVATSAVIPARSQPPSPAD
jgi:low temperature requirement protein LtrA